MADLVFGYGLCECGCGQKTTIASRTDKSRGAVKGEPRRFVRSHGMKNRPVGAETMAQRGMVSTKCAPGCKCGRHNKETHRRRQTGRRPSASTRAKMSASQKRYVKNNPGVRTAAARKARAARRHLPSSIEIDVRNCLTGLGIDWEGGRIVRGFHPDLVIESKKMVIEVQGCYWHGCTSCFPKRKNCRHRKRDKVKAKVYALAGYQMVEIWEHSINENLLRAVMEAINYGR